MTQAPGQYGSDITVQFLHGLGVSGDSLQNVDPTALQAVEDALDARHDGDISVLDGFSFKDVGSVADFTRILGWAEQFAAVTGYRYFVPLKYLAAMSESFWSQQAGGWDKQKAFQAFYDRLPSQAQQAMPYAQTGLTAEDYNSAAASFVDTVQRYTGNRNVDQTLVQQAVREHWSPDRFMSSLTSNAQFNSQYGWVQYGKTYQDWLNYKVQNQQEIATRYGTSAAQGTNADSYFLQNLQNPLQRVNAAPASGSQPIGPMQTSQAAQFVRTVDPSHSSSVR